MPAVVLYQEPAHDRSEGHAAAEDGRPDGEREGPLLGVGEDGAQDRHGGGHDGRAADAEQGAGRDHVPGLGGEHGYERSQREDAEARHEQPLAPPAVTERPRGDQQTGQGECVDVDDPQLLHGARLQVADERGEGHVEDRGVHGDEQEAAGEDRQDDPPAGGRRGGVHEVPFRGCARWRAGQGAGVPAGGCAPVRVPLRKDVRTRCPSWRGAR